MNMNIGHICVFYQCSKYIQAGFVCERFLIHPLSKTQLAALRGPYCLNEATTGSGRLYVARVHLCRRWAHTLGRDAENRVVPKAEDPMVSCAPAQFRGRLQTGSRKLPAADLSVGSVLAALPSRTWASTRDTQRTQAWWVTPHPLSSLTQSSQERSTKVVRLLPRAARAAALSLGLTSHFPVSLFWKERECSHFKNFYAIQLSHHIIVYEWDLGLFSISGTSHY